MFAAVFRFFWSSLVQQGAASPAIDAVQSLLPQIAATWQLCGCQMPHPRRLMGHPSCSISGKKGTAKLLRWVVSFYWPAHLPPYIQLLCWRHCCDLDSKTRFLLALAGAIRAVQVTLSGKFISVYRKALFSDSVSLVVCTTGSF